MGHFTECLLPGEESVEEMREGGRGKGEPSCDWRVRVAVDGCLAKHGDTSRVALLIFNCLGVVTIYELRFGKLLAPP